MSFSFELDAKYPANFPAELDLAEDDPLSFQTYGDAYQAAQKARIPYYVVAVAESTKGSDLNQKDALTTYYHTYDMTHFGNYLAERRKTNQPLLDPVSRETITRIHYFSVKCFGSDAENLFCPLALDDHQIKLRPFSLPSHPVALAMLRESLDSEILLDEADKKIQQARRMQYLIADYIKKGAVFPDLPSEERNEEALYWLWCSAKGSHRAVVRLYKECQQLQKFAAAKVSFLMQLVQTSVTVNPKLPHLERAAIQEARKLIANW